MLVEPDEPQPGGSRQTTITPSSLGSGPDPDEGDRVDLLDHWDTFIIDPADDQVTMIIGHNKYPLLIPTTSQYEDVRSVVPLTPMVSDAAVRRSVEEVKRVMPEKSENYDACSQRYTTQDLQRVGEATIEPDRDLEKKSHSTSWQADLHW